MPEPFLLQLRSKAPLPAMQENPDRAGAPTRCPGDLFDGEISQIAETNDFPLRGRKFGYRLPYGPSRFIGDRERDG
jgi:hypothetical protein